MVGFKRLEPTGAIHVKWRIEMPGEIVMDNVSWYDQAKEYPHLLPPLDIQMARLMAIEKELI